MQRDHHSRPALMALAAAIGLAAFTMPATAGEMNTPMKSHPSQGEVRTLDRSDAMLMTTASGAFVSVTTDGLMPGHVHTLWFVAINAPEACESAPCKTPDVLKRTALTRSDVGFADSLIVGDDGVGRFAAHVPVGNLRQAWFDHGYEQTETAEVHLVVQDHGPALPHMTTDMLSSYRGGCTDESLPDPVPTTARADGTPGPNQCRMVQFTVFEQTARQS